MVAVTLDELTQRVTALEAEVGVLRQETAAARALATGADRDVAEYRAELRGHTRVLAALRETQVEQGQQITRLNEKVGQLDGRVDHLDGKVDQLSGIVGHIRDQHGARLTEIVGLLSKLIDREGGQP